MLGRIFLGAALGAIVMMLVGFIFWGGVMAPFSVVQPISNEAAAVAALNDAILESGVYVYPFPDMSSDTDAFVEKHLAGPVMQVFFIKEGVNPQSPFTFVAGLVHFFVSALLLGALLYLALPRLTSYDYRVLFIFLAGVFAAVSVNLSNPIWWHHPWGFHLYSAAFNAVGWLLAGLVMAWIIKPIHNRT